jgi:hypothetical protein
MLYIFIFCAFLLFESSCIFLRFFLHHPFLCFQHPKHFVSCVICFYFLHFRCLNRLTFLLCCVWTFFFTFVTSIFSGMLCFIFAFCTTQFKKNMIFGSNLVANASFRFKLDLLSSLVLT